MLLQDRSNCYELVHIAQVGRRWPLAEIGNADPRNAAPQREEHGAAVDVEE